ncbi:uncharacterized protein LOC120209615 [Hibiscus syriacus]|uniref:uncharacterized protein LOC120209615 n=1 Tax=Hibiscus syriacus TaxID=106335 RepID=UPI001921AD87|nr:uncharacterized protein LOC120209615 [Hibiscus syriacus]
MYLDVADPESLPCWSGYTQFILTVNNQIQLEKGSSFILLSMHLLFKVWDSEKRLLSHVHVFKEEITSFAVMQTDPYMYVGDSDGIIKVFKIEEELLMVSQLTDDNQCVYTAPPELPSFSDVKDSDDEGFSNCLNDDPMLEMQPFWC